MLLSAAFTGMAYGAPPNSCYTAQANHTGLTDWGIPTYPGYQANPAPTPADPHFAMPVAKFNASLGTLNSAVVSLSGSMTATATFLNNQAGVAPQMTLETTPNLHVYSPSFISNVYGSSSVLWGLLDYRQRFNSVPGGATVGFGSLVGQTDIFRNVLFDPATYDVLDNSTHIAFTPSFTVNDAGVLGQMSGAGNIDFSADTVTTTSTAYPGGNASIVNQTTATANISVTYLLHAGSR